MSTVLSYSNWVVGISTIHQDYIWIFQSFTNNGKIQILVEYSMAMLYPSTVGISISFTNNSPTICCREKKLERIACSPASTVPKGMCLARFLVAVRTPKQHTSRGPNSSVSLGLIRRHPNSINPTIHGLHSSVIIRVI